MESEYKRTQVKDLLKALDGVDVSCELFGWDDESIIIEATNLKKVITVKNGNILIEDE